MKTQDSNFAVALKGGTLVSIVGAEVGKDEVTFKTKSGRTFRMFHSQDCCETVKISRVSSIYCSDGNGIEVTEAEEKIEHNIPASESATRTTFIVNKGTYSGFFIEWIGESNGYYSESVSFVEDIA